MGRTARRAATLIALLAVLMGFTGCSVDDPVEGASSDPTEASSSSPTEAASAPSPTTERVSRLETGEAEPVLECGPRGRVALAIDYAPDAKGASSPEEAVAEHAPGAGTAAVVSAEGDRAWLLREDGSVQRVLTLDRIDGWVVGGEERCAE